MFVSSCDKWQGENANQKQKQKTKNVYVSKKKIQNKIKNKLFSTAIISN